MTFRVAVRSLLKNRIYSVVVILTLALGIGANTLIFTVLNSVILKPLPYSDPDSLVTIWNVYGKPKRMRTVSSAPDYFDRKEQSASLGSVAAYQKTGLALVGLGEPERLDAARVTASIFPLLGVNAHLGRYFSEAEDRQGSNPVVVLSYGFWSTRFAKASNVLGQTLNLGGVHHTITGVMPKQFWFPDQETELWVPLVFTTEQRANSERGNESFNMIGRIADGRNLQQVRSELSTIASRVLELAPERREFLENSKWDADAEPLRESLFGEVRPTLLLLMAATSFLLLLTCANVANLVMTRNLERRKEVAIRTALGAERSHLLSIFLSESLLLSFCGGALGLFLAFASFDLMRAVAPQDVPRIQESSIDLGVFAFSAAISFISAIVFGVSPLVLTRSKDLTNSLKEGSRSSSGRSLKRARYFLVFSETTLALILFAGAILFGRSFVNLLNQKTGFQISDRLTFGVTLPRANYPEPIQRINRFEEIHQRIERIPGVIAAGANGRLPMTGENWTATFGVQGHTPAPGQPAPGFEYRIITPGYLKAMGIVLKAGRDFNERDSETSTPVAIVDEVLANQYWPNENPIGKRISFGGDQPVWQEVIGVAGHVRNISPSQPGSAQVYLPHSQMPISTMYFVVHSGGNPLDVVPQIREQVGALDPNLPLYRIQTVDRLVDGAVAKPRFQIVLLGCFALLALMLAAVGIYGVVSYSVNQRQNEIGLRMALGATHSMILRYVIQTSMAPVIAGVIAGVLGSFVLARLIRNLLYGIAPADPSALVSAALLMLLTALAATFIPASRAARTDAASVLRSE